MRPTSKRQRRRGSQPSLFMADTARGERGASLPIALLGLVLVSVVLIGLTGYATTSTKATTPYANLQLKKYAADGAMRAAINFVGQNTNLGREVAGDPSCGYRVPASENGTTSNITVTCAAVAGTNSGVPAQTGKTPDQALLLLGQRYGEVPSYSPCTGSINDRRDSNGREVGLLLDTTNLKKSGGGAATCLAGSGNIDTTSGFKVNGDIKSNAPVRVKDGRLEVSNGSIAAGTSPEFYLNANPAKSCTGNIAFTGTTIGSCTVLASGSRTSPAGATNDPYNPGESLLTDPALGTNGADWRQGTINWTAPKLSINGAAPVALTNATSLTGCNKDNNLVRFYPGFYTSAADLNRVFNDAGCRKGIFWFGPAADTSDATTATKDASLALLQPGSSAQQGVYAFDFRDTSGGIACNALENTNYHHRWCLKADSTTDGGPLVVGGWPKGWDPTAVLAAPASSPGTFTTTSLTSASTVNTDGSLTWSTPNDAKTINAAVTTYSPTGFLHISTSRSIVLSGFGSVTAVKPDGTISITVKHQESRAGHLDLPAIEVNTSDRGTPVSCGSFSFPKSTDNSGDVANALQSSVVSTSSLPLADRTRLRSCFSNAERVKNVSIRFKVTGDTFNLGTCTPLFGWEFLGPLCDNALRPKVFLDGMKIDIDVPTGGFFDAGVALPATYCDPAKPGVQFVFGGDSTVHAGTTALQLCAGPAPSNPDSYQQIAVWGQPVNFLTKAPAASGDPQVETRVGKTGSTSLVATSVAASTSCPFICTITPQWTNPTNAIKPGNVYSKPSDPSTPVTADLSSGNSLFGATSGTLAFSGFGKVLDYGATGCTTSTATNLCIDTATQKVSKVELKVGYNSDCGIGGWFCPLGAWADYSISSTGGATACPSGTDDFPPTSKMTWYTIDVTSCFASNPTALINGAKVNLTMRCGWPCIDNKKKVEGLELLVTIGPKTPTAQEISPSSGCLLGSSGYGSGVGDTSPSTASTPDGAKGPDCALISGGRVSVQGTIYSPNDALEIADGDVMYPFASRGVVARHLRVRKFTNRPPYQDPSISSQLDKSASDRQVEFTACIRSSSDLSTKCGSLTGDVVLVRAGVQFTTDQLTPVDAGGARLKVPQVLWWDSQTG